MHVLILPYLLLSFIVAWYGSSRDIGFLGSLLISIIFSPLIGFICVALSSKTEFAPPRTQKEIESDKVNQLYKLRKLRDSGDLSEQQFKQKKIELGLMDHSESAINIPDSWKK